MRCGADNFADASRRWLGVFLECADVPSRGVGGTIGTGALIATGSIHDGSGIAGRLVDRQPVTGLIGGTGRRSRA
jgi:hypothetical protein